MEVPILTKIADTNGPDEAIIVIKGYLSDKSDPEEVSDDYVQRLRDVGWQGSIYNLWWDASIEDRISIGENVSSALISPRAMGTIEIEDVLGTWKYWIKVKERAKRAGRDHTLPLIREQVVEKKVSLLGHSLGARVAYYAMRTISSNLLALRADLKFENVYLLGGVVRRDSSKDWGKVALSVRGQIVNVHNKDDNVLSKYYRSLELRQNACGRKKIKEEHPKITNIDARYVINSTCHAAYRKYLFETIAVFFHR